MWGGRELGRCGRVECGVWAWAPARGRVRGGRRPAWVGASSKTMLETPDA